MFKYDRYILVVVLISLGTLMLIGFAFTTKSNQEKTGFTLKISRQFRLNAGHGKIATSIPQLDTLFNLTQKEYRTLIVKKQANKTFLNEQQTQQNAIVLYTDIRKQLTYLKAFLETQDKLDSSLQRQQIKIHAIKYLKQNIQQLSSFNELEKQFKNVFLERNMSEATKKLYLSYFRSQIQQIKEINQLEQKVTAHMLENQNLDELSETITDRILAEKPIRALW